MSCAAILALPDELIDRVVFSRRQDVKSDPVVCEVHSLGVVYYATQDDKQWIAMLERLEAIEGFMKGWSAQMSRPPFKRLEMVAFDRPRTPLLPDSNED